MNLNLLNEPNTSDFIQFSKELSPLSSCSLSSPKDKFILHKISKQLRAGAIVVEIGTYLGGSAAIIAHANPEVTVHSFDLFDNLKYDPAHDKLLEKTLGPNKERSLENVAKNLSQYSNIHLHKVSPLEEINFNDKIDLFIEDAEHRDPSLTKSLTFWLPKINADGFLLLHDYRPWLPLGHRLRFLDVEKHATKLKDSNDWNFLGNFHSFAIFQKK